jgi:hypothetical protein
VYGGVSRARRCPIKASTARIVLALAAFAVAAPAAALAGDRTAPAGQQIGPLGRVGAACSVINLVIVSDVECGVGHQYLERCFEGEGGQVGGPPFDVRASYGHLYANDDRIFSHTTSINYNFAGPYFNVNFFANANYTHLLGHYHGGGLGIGEGSGLGSGHWRTCPESSARLAPVIARRPLPSRSSASVHGGHRSPAMAVTGFVEGFNQNHRRNSCSYAKPSLQDRCRSAFKRLRRISIRVRDFRVVSSRRSRNRARVKVSGKGCLGARCRPLSGASGNRTVTVRVRRVSKRWYIR